MSVGETGWMEYGIVRRVCVCVCVYLDTYLDTWAPGERENVGSERWKMGEGDTGDTQAKKGKNQ